MDLGTGHAGFVAAVLAGGGLTDFYAELRWPGWEGEVGGLGADEGVAVYPPPFTEQGRDIAASSRRPVPLSELLEFYDEAAAQLADTPDGTVFSFRIA